MTLLVARQSRDFTELFRLERHAFAAKIRLARAVLGWSQSDLGSRIGLTQRSIHKLEQGETEPRRTTMRALEEIWREHHLEFEDLADGSFRVSIRAEALEQPTTARVRPRKSPKADLGVTSLAHRAS
ncbi:MAG TPA: helix-turn-helix transcriptional regulator [Pseudolabrys sp.]|nr:helix-turn-helix transcriptional regulator [Pseudolabrys sp.]